MGTVILCKHDPQVPQTAGSSVSICNPELLCQMGGGDKRIFRNPQVHLPGWQQASSSVRLCLKVLMWRADEEGSSSFLWLLRGCTLVHNPKTDRHGYTDIHAWTHTHMKSYPLCPRWCLFTFPRVWALSSWQRELQCASDKTLMHSWKLGCCDLITFQSASSYALLQRCRVVWMLRGMPPKPSQSYSSPACITFFFLTTVFWKAVEFCVELMTLCHADILCHLGPLEG